MLTIHENASKGVYVESARVSFTSMEEFSIVYCSLGFSLDC